MAILKLTNGQSINYYERPDSPKESYAGAVGKAVRIFDVAWGDRLKFLAGILGWSQPSYAADGTFQYVRRIPPMAYAPIGVPHTQSAFVGKQEANDFWMYATSVDSIEPIGIDRSSKSLLAKKNNQGNLELTAKVKDSDEMFHHDKARITITFEALPYRVTPDNDMRTLGFQSNGVIDESYMWRYVSRTVQPHAEHLTLPFGRLKWQADAPTGLNNTSASNQVGRIVPSLEFVWTWHQVPGFPEQAFTMIGSVNSDPIYDYSPSTSRAWTYEAGTLLFLGMELKTYRMATGIYCNDVVYRMKYFSAIQPHNGQFYSPARGHNYFMAFHQQVGTAPNSYAYSYQKLVDASDDKRGVYQSADLRKLFTLPGKV